MNHLHLATTFLLMIAISGSAAERPAVPSSLVVAGYLPDYHLAQWDGQIGPLTDLMFFGMSAPKDGRFDASAISTKHLDAIKGVKDRSKCRLLFTIGGWEKSEGFAPLVADEKLRKQFIHDAREYCLRHGFDGIDYDWEHPKGKEQIDGLAKLLKETREAFAPRQLLVTVAVAGWQDLGREVYEAADRVHLMSYDHDFPHATLEKSKADVDRLIKAGCPPQKLVLGLPLYGRNKAGQTKPYAQLAHGRGLAGEVDLIDGYAINGPATLAAKVHLARQRKLAGVMIWEIAQDLSGAESLRTAIANEVNR